MEGRRPLLLENHRLLDITASADYDDNNNMMPCSRLLCGRGAAPFYLFINNDHEQTRASSPHTPNIHPIPSTPLSHTFYPSCYSVVYCPPPKNGRRTTRTTPRRRPGPRLDAAGAAFRHCLGFRVGWGAVGPAHPGYHKSRFPLVDGA